MNANDYLMHDKVIVASWALFSYFIPRFQFVSKMIALEVLKLLAQWPKSAKFKELDVVPMLNIDNVGRLLTDTDAKELIGTVFDDIELTLSCVNFEIKQILEILFENEAIFRFKDIDYLVLSKRGSEVLVLEFAAKTASKVNQNSRSLFIEIAAYRSYCLNVTLWASGIMFGLGVVFNTFVVNSK